MAREDHIGLAAAAGYCRPIKHPPEETDMDYIWLFLLFFAALAAGWFYLQRAKARPTTTVTTTTAEAPAAPATSEVATTAETADERPAS